MEYIFHAVHTNVAEFYNVGVEDLAQFFGFKEMLEETSL